MNVKYSFLGWLVFFPLLHFYILSNSLMLLVISVHIAD